MPILEASQLRLNDVHRLLKLQRQPGGSFTETLSLEPLTETEQNDLSKIQQDFEQYLDARKISEGLVKFLTLAPLMRLAGYFAAPIRLSMEDSIPIEIEVEDTIIRGRLDILAINSDRGTTTDTPFWVLVIEAKSSLIEVFEGLPYLLTYCYKSLDKHSSVWGLSTNGLRYQFVRVRQGDPPTYQLMPELNLIERDRAIQLAQIFKAICQEVAVK